MNSGGVYEGSLHRQRDGRRGGIELGDQVAHRGVPHGQGRTLDGPQQLDDATVLEPDLVVEEAAQLLGAAEDRLLGALGGVEPVEVDAAQTAVDVDGIEVHELLEEAGELVTAGTRQEKVVEGLEAATLIGVGDGVAFADDLVEQLTLATLPRGDVGADVAVKGAEVLLRSGSRRAARGRCC